MNTTAIARKKGVMAHLVLGYPSLQESIETAVTYIEAGCAILELQIPFSHPTADGPVITQACQYAVEQHHTTVADCLEAIGTIAAKYPEQEIIVMTYLNRLFTFGIEAFTTAMLEMGVERIIVPDLPVHTPIAQKFISFGVKLVPVLAANVGDARLSELLAQDFDFYYLMSDFKITGSGFSLNPRLQQIIATIRNRKPDASVGIGFGISSREQVAQVLETADYAIIGSSLIKAKAENRLHEYLNSLQMS